MSILVETVEEIAPGTGASDDVSAAAAALRALGATEDGAALAGQLSRLVLVIANEAVRTKRFRTDLVAALLPEPAGGGAGASSPSGARSQLGRLTKAKLKSLIDHEGMDPEGRIRSRSTKDEMIDLIVAFRKDAPEVAAAAVDSPAAQVAGSAEPVASPEEHLQQEASTVSPTDMPAPPANPPKRRRRPSPLDPYAVAASDGVEGLREQLQRFDIEELKDVIAEYGMNYDGRAMGWHDHQRFVDRIIEKADFGSTQGNAFRSGR